MKFLSDNFRKIASTEFHSYQNECQLFLPIHSLMLIVILIKLKEHVW